MYKFFIAISIVFACSISHAEWQLVNENDPNDEMEIYVDFHESQNVGEFSYKVPMRTSTLSNDAVDAFPMPLYEPYINATFIVDCKDMTITTKHRQLNAQLAKNGEFVDILSMFNLSEEASTRPLVLNDIVDNTLHQRLCQFYTASDKV